MAEGAQRVPRLKIASVCGGARPNYFGYMIDTRAPRCRNKLSQLLLAEECWLRDAAVASSGSDAVSNYGCVVGSSGPSVDGGSG